MQPTDLKHLPDPHLRLGLPPPFLEPLQRIPHPQHRRLKRNRGEDHQPKAHLPRLVRAHIRRDATAHHVQQTRGRPHALDHLPRFRLARHRLGKHGVDATLDRGPEPLVRLVKPERLPSVRPRDDQDVQTVALARLHGGAELRAEHLAAHQLLAEQVAAAFLLHLVLDVQRRDACGSVPAHRAGYHDRAAVAGVGVGDQWDRRVQRCQRLGLRDHVALRGQPEVRPAQSRHRGAGPGHVEGGEADGEGEARGDAVVDARGDDERGRIG